MVECITTLESMINLNTGFRIINLEPSETSKSMLEITSKIIQLPMLPSETCLCHVKNIF